jgi:membrane protease subunit HflC
MPERRALGKTWTRVAVVAGAILAMAAWRCFFVVDESERVVITEFGRPTQVLTEPGLGFKYPQQSLQAFERRLLVYAAPPSEFLTIEKTPVVAAGTVLWRVGDPKRYFETVAERGAAESRLGDVLYAELGAAIGQSPLASFVSVAPDDRQADAIIGDVAARCRAVAARDYGIDVVDVQLRQFDFPKQSRARLYARMTSERGRISMRYRSEGEEAGLAVRAEAEAERGRILGDAAENSLRTKGEGDAVAAHIYGAAIGEAPEFYAFLRALDAARRGIGKDATLVLPGDSPLFGLLHDSDYFVGGSERRAEGGRREQGPP